MATTEAEVFDFVSAPFLEAEAHVPLHFERILGANESPRMGQRLLLESALLITCFRAKYWRRDTVLFSMPPPQSVLNSIGEDPGVSILVSGRGTYAYARREGLPHLVLGNMPRLLLESVDKHDTLPHPAHMMRTLSIYRRFVERSGVRAIVLSANYTPGFRLLAYAAREFGVPIVFYPHGMLGNPRLAVETDYGLSDYWLTWTESERRAVISAGVSPNRAYCVGPYRDITRCPPQRPVRSLLYLGTRGPTISESEAIQVAERVAKVCSESGLEFSYRPHPGQNPDLWRQSKILSSRLAPQSSLNAAVCATGIVVGFPSTALLESKTAGPLTVCIASKGPGGNAPDPEAFSDLQMPVEDLLGLIGDTLGVTEAADRVQRSALSAATRLERFLLDEL